MTSISPIVSAYAPQLLSHQTGLSVTASAASVLYNIGSSISVPRSGILKVTIIGHVNGSDGLIGLQLTRGTTNYMYGGQALGRSLFGSNGNPYITSTTPIPLNYVMQLNPNALSTVGYASSPFTMEILVLAGDVIQLLAGNYTAGDITYIDDLVVTLQ